MVSNPFIMKYFVLALALFCAVTLSAQTPYAADISAITLEDTAPNGWGGGTQVAFGLNWTGIVKAGVTVSSSRPGDADRFGVGLIVEKTINENPTSTFNYPVYLSAEWANRRLGGVATDGATILLGTAVTFKVTNTIWIGPTIAGGVSTNPNLFRLNVGFMAIYKV